MTKILESIEKYILYMGIAVFPLFILLNSTSPAVLPKAELLVAAESLFLLVWVVKTFVKGSISFSFGKFDFPVLLFAIAYCLSALFATPNKMEAFLIPGVATFAVAGAVFYFLINQVDKKGKIGIAVAFMLSGVLYAIVLLLAGLNFFSKIPQLPAAIKDPTFNPLGGPVQGISFLLPLIILTVGYILREKETVKKVFWGVSTAVMIMAGAILVNSSLPGKPQAPSFPGFATSWEVAVTTVAKAPIFGVGPGNYLSAFTQYLPVTYNQTALWSVRFTAATDYYLTALTETGFLGLLALVLLVMAVYKSVRHDMSIENLALPALLVVYLFFPAFPVLFVSLFILLSLSSDSEGRVVTLNTLSAGTNIKFAPKIPAILLGILILAGVASADYFGAKVVMAEATFTRALTAISGNDAKNSYSLVSQAVNENPQVDRYHATLAQLDMALAQSLANQKTVSDADKTTITQLVQQAINEGKNTVVLNPTRSGNWELLAQIYRSIMPFATGADQFAIQTYSQAIALDPTNPNLRISLGGVYYALGQYDNAVSAFNLATLAKPDLANAHYNLALAYKAKNDYDDAITEMNTVLTLVPKGSQDYQLAESTLSDLQKNKPAPKAAAGGNLTTPQAVAPSNVKPPITLPQEATPPAATQQ